MPTLVCYCLRVEKAEIIQAIESGCSSVDALSACLRVCTGCGGCRPDLEDMLRFYRNEAGPQSSAPAPIRP